LCSHTMGPLSICISTDERKWERWLPNTCVRSNLSHIIKRFKQSPARFLLHGMTKWLLNSMALFLENEGPRWWPQIWAIWIHTPPEGWHT
jgi:hypothetical protein